MINAGFWSIFDHNPSLITRSHRGLGAALSGNYSGMSNDNTVPAGEGLSDEEMVRQVAEQTDSEHQQADVFEREADGATTDTEAAKADADELQG